MIKDFGRLLLGLLALALIGAGVYQWGHAVGGAEQRARAAAAQADAVRNALAQQQREFEKRLKDNAAAAQALQRRARAAEAALLKAKKETEHVPIVIAQRCDASRVDVSLSHGAVRVWNTALAGDAGASVASGACRADAASAEACAAGSGISVERAHANAVENFARFNVCLNRLDALQDLIAARERGFAGAPASLQENAP